MTVVDVATETTLALLLARQSDFALVAKATPCAGEELRFDDVAGGDFYIGANADNTATATATWKVVRYYRTATGTITRARYRTAVAWDNRTAGWT